MSNKLEVLDIEAEEIPLEQKIENALIKENVTEKVINALKEKYGSLRLKSLDDKEAYLDIKEGVKNIRKVEIIAEKIFKSLREDAIKTQRYCLSKEKEFLSKTSSFKSALDEELKKFEDEVERKSNEEKELKEAAYMQRQSILIKYGAAYNNGSFELNHISYEVDNIRESDNEIWEEIILPKYKSEFEKVEAIRVAQEKERESVALKLKQEQDELKRQQEELRQGQLALQKKQQDAERLEQQRIDNEKILQREKETSLLNSRLKQLSGITWNGVLPFYHYGSTIITTQEKLLLMDESEFETLRDKHNSQVAKDKEVAEEKRIADAEKQRQADIESALQKERDRVAEEKMLLDLKDSQEKQRQEEEMAKASDKEKWNMWIGVVKEILPPTTMRSNIYKSKVAIAKEKISEILSL